MVLAMAVLIAYRLQQLPHGRVLQDLPEDRVRTLIDFRYLFAGHFFVAPPDSRVLTAFSRRVFSIT
jgi:hypothetical protein